MKLALTIFRVAASHTEVRTMKLEGNINGASVLVLIDSGATHNFISPTVVEALGLHMVSSTPLGVCLGDGHRILTLGKCKGLQLTLGGFNISFDAYVLELGGVDVILGVVWLETLGKVTMDWKEMYMVFNHKGQLVKLQGQQLGEKTTTFQSVVSQQRVIKGCCWYITKEVNGDTELKKGVQEKELNKLLNRYAPVFKDIEGLPPVRNISHAIVLHNGVDPVSVRPYRYPHHQKDEIERQISNLLQQGVIRNSTSAFSSPVILVKKKDNSWRMCVDYRALNKVMVQEKYPIPVVDELLDELHGSSCFSKLDLKSG